MVYYRRNYIAGGTYFFTVNLRNRQADYLTRYVSHLRAAFKETKNRYPFKTIAMVVLPEHLHAVWELPTNDADFSKRWRRIKTVFTERLKHEGLKLLRDKRKRIMLWQERYWEHTIYDEEDLIRCVDYVHYNPVK